MRSFHRWLTTLLGVVLVFMGVTGFLIETDDLLALAGFGPNPAAELSAINGGAAFMDPNFIALGAGNAPPALNQTSLPADQTNLATNLLGRLNQIAPDAPITSVTESAIDGRPRFTIGFVSARPPLTLDAQTGAILPAAAPPPGGMSFHDYVKGLHNGTFLAAPGVWIIAATGLTLLLLSLSGLWIYIKMWLQRRSLGRTGIFWSSGEPILWRRLHRYVSIVAMLVLAWISVTGLLLAADDLVVRWSKDYPAAMLRPGLPGSVQMAPPAAVPLPLADLPGTLTRITQTVAQHVPNYRIFAIKLSGANPAEVIVKQQYAVLLKIDPASGTWLNQATGLTGEPSPYVGSLHWHQILKRLHRGDIIGMGGRWLIELGALSLLYLSISGLVMYGQMLARRCAIGRGGWFW